MEASDSKCQSVARLGVARVFLCPGYCPTSASLWWGRWLRRWSIGMVVLVLELPAATNCSTQYHPEHLSMLANTGWAYGSSFQWRQALDVVDTDGNGQLNFDCNWDGDRDVAGFREIFCDSLSTGTQATSHYGKALSWPQVAAVSGLRNFEEFVYFLTASGPRLNRIQTQLAQDAALVHFHCVDILPWTLTLSMVMKWWSGKSVCEQPACPQVYQHTEGFTKDEAGQTWRLCNCFRFDEFFLFV